MTTGIARRVFEGEHSVAEHHPSFRVSRRNFLRSAGAGAALAVGGGAIAFRDSRAFAQGSWDQEADIIVVGSGAAALSAAAVAVSLGNEVVVFEKGETVGGTTAKSGGTYWVPNNSLMRAEGLEDPKEDAIRYMVRLAYPAQYNPDAEFFGIPEHEYRLIEGFYDNGPVAIDTLAEIGALKSTLKKNIPEGFFPDYFAELPENKAPVGRGLQPELPDEPGAEGAGNELIRQLAAYLSDNGVEVQVGHRVVAVIQNDAGEIIGAEVVANAGGSATPEAGATPVAEGQTINVRARKAVIFGSGGYTHNPELVLNYLRGPIFGGCAVPTNEGDFVSIAGAVGADFGTMKQAFLAQVVVEQALEFSSVPSDVFMLWGDSTIMVNAEGKRILNEKKTYNERTQVHWYWEPVTAKYPNLVTFMVYDQRAVETAGGYYPITPEGVDAPYIITGETWEELAQNLDDRLATLEGHTNGIRLADDWAEQMKETIARYNQFAEAGVDEDFHRGESPIEPAFDALVNGGDNGMPNPTMHPIAETGPYYAIIIGPGTLDTKGGPKVDVNSQVLDTEGNPIPGLYGAGNCVMASSGQAYWAAGGTLGPALATGYMAAVTANEEPVKDA